AAQLNGKWIKASDLQSTSASSSTPAIGDSEIGINLVDSTGKTVKSFNWKKDGAQKGSVLGTQNVNGNWELASGDQNSIQAQINTALTGTGYSLTSLSAAQVSALAQAKFGASVNLTVNASTNVADNQVKVTFVNANNNTTVGSATVSRQSGDNTATQTINRYNNNDGFTQGNVAGYWTTQISALSNYGFDGLTAAQKATNNAVLNNANFGTEIKVLVAPLAAPQAFAATSYVFATGASGVTVNGDSGTADNGAQNVQNATYLENADNNTPQQFGTALNAFAAAVRGSNGTSVSDSTITTALKNQGLYDFYVVSTDNGATLKSNTNSLDAGNVQVWHYTFKNITGNSLINDANNTPTKGPRINYTVQKKTATVGSNGSVAWSTLFNQ
ncbi:MAG: hypothetical protein ABF723_14175, partial [Lentilactobacillus hilgardii]